MGALDGLVEALAPDHALHTGSEYETDGKDVQVKCSCGVRLTFLAAQIAAIRPPPTPSSPKTKAGG